MSNVILPISMWAAIGLAALSILVIGISGLRGVWYGKVQPLTIAVISIPGILVLIFGFIMPSWAQAGIYTLVVMFGLVVLAMIATGLRQLYAGAFG
ncbi:MAG: hypothetical protein BRD35_00990 [Bacteroidetes bacterium QH_7_62_13]|nr:MAG: hypothetical protein BRD35_00990 [Bacteroidetes bacterium QH_7_62_13]